MASKEKECIACEETKPNSEYRRGQPVCKECENDPDVHYEKRCRDCNDMKSNDLFRKNRKMCLDCERSFGREYRQTTTKAKDWAEENKERMTELQSQWYEKNKKKIRQKESTRLKEDKQFRVIKSYRISISQMMRGEIKRNKGLGLSRCNYVIWLEFCFRDDMSLENHHEVWYIDHVLPLDLLLDTCKTKCVGIVRDNSDSQKLLFSWYNTYPLDKGTNRIKSNNVDAKTLYKHLRKLRKFLKANKKEKDELYYSYVKLVRQIIEEMSQSQ
jgi:hypothetical protein